MDKIGDGMSKVKRWKHNTEQCYLMTQYFKFKKKSVPTKTQKETISSFVSKKVKCPSSNTKIVTFTKVMTMQTFRSVTYLFL